MVQTHMDVEAYVAGIREDVREEWDMYAGLATGAGLEAYDRATEGDLFTDHFNAWGGDKLVHGAFCYGLAKGTIRAFEGAGSALRTVAGRTRNETVAGYLEQAAETVEQPTFQQKILVSGMAVATFSVTKEHADAYWDWLDIAANTAGWGIATADEYRATGSGEAEDS